LIYDTSSVLIELCLTDFSFKQKISSSSSFFVCIFLLYALGRKDWQIDIYPSSWFYLEWPSIEGKKNDDEGKERKHDIERRDVYVYRARFCFRLLSFFFLTWNLSSSHTLTGFIYACISPVVVTACCILFLVIKLKTKKKEKKPEWRRKSTHFFYWHLLTLCAHYLLSFFPSYSFSL